DAPVTPDVILGVASNEDSVDPSVRSAVIHGWLLGVRGRVLHRPFRLPSFLNPFACVSTPRIIRLRPDNFTPPARTPWGGTRLLGRFKRHLGITGMPA